MQVWVQGKLELGNMKPRIEDAFWKSHYITEDIIKIYPKVG